MLGQMTKRLAVYLPDGVYEFLEKWATDERRSVSNLAAVLLELNVRDRENWKPQNKPETIQLGSGSDRQ
jgi:hypothetical protein